MTSYRSLPVLAVRRMLGNWRLLSSVVVGTLVAAAILSATAIYADAIRDLGLRFALEQRNPTTLDVEVSQSNITVSPSAYERSRQRQDQAIRRALRDVATGVTRHATTATFFPTEPGSEVDRADANRPRANLFFRSGLEDHIEVVEGRLPTAMVGEDDGPLEVLIGADTAERLGIEVGDRFALHPFWDETAIPLLVEVVGTGRVNDPDERYWGRRTEQLDARQRSWETLLLAVPEETFFGPMHERLRTATADYQNVYAVDTGALNARNALDRADGLRGLRAQLGQTETRVNVRSDLETVLRTFDEKLFFTRIPLFVLLLQIGGIVAYYLVMVSTMLIERQAAEIATLRSRGATTSQLLAQYGVEGGILAVLAAIVGPPLAAGLISALGPTPAFAALSGGGPLEVHIGGAAYVLAAVGALIAFLALMLPAWRATRSTVVEFKRSSARPRPTPLFLRYYLDVLLVVVGALIFWRLSRQEELFTETIFGETQADPFLLATPAVFMVTVGIVFLRLFPLVLVIAAWIIEQTKSVAVLVGMRSVVRNPTHYTRLILLLMFATGVGMFGATFSATLAQSYEDRAAYAVGSDLRVGDVRHPEIRSDGELIAFLDGVRAEAFSPLMRSDGSVLRANASAEVQFLGVDPASFGEVALFREDFMAGSLDDMLATLATNEATYEGIRLPEETQQVGVWMRFPDIRGRVSVGYVARDGSGRTVQRFLADARPGDEATGEWRFYSAVVDEPLTRFAAPGRPDPLERPLEVVGLFVAPQGRVASERGVVEFGPMLVTDGDERLWTETSASETAWPGAVMVTDFSAEQFEPVAGLRRQPGGESLRRTGEGPPGYESSMRFDWQQTQFGAGMRGIRVRTDGEPTLIYLSNKAMAALDASPGDEVTLSMAARYVTGVVAGSLDFFPTYDTEQRRGFAVVSASRARAETDAAMTDRTLELNEVWFRTSTPEATAADLEPLDAREFIVREQVLLEQQEDPLIAAGWSGILAISFGAVLFLSAIGFVVYSYLTAQQRGLEFAILRTLGLSRPQVFSVVLFEHLLIIAAGMGLGTIVGLQVGRFMMDFLATDERGAAVLPPFILQVSWGEVALVWAILGTVFVVTIAAVVALYFRLAVHRALRIGDV